jgi:2-haloacid dehalogenase
MCEGDNSARRTGKAHSEGPLKAVIYDIGGVIVDWNPRYLYRKLIDDADQMEWFLAEVCSPSWNAMQDQGRKFALGVEEAASAYPEYRELIVAYWKRWPEMLGGTIPGMPELLAETQQEQVPLYAITNWSAETYPIAVRSYPVLNSFLDVVVSGETGLIKPDEQIFRYSLDRFDLAPEEVLFVDDNLANVEAAASVGMHATQFSTVRHLRDVLLDFGLLCKKGKRHSI